MTKLETIRKYVGQRVAFQFAKDKRTGIAFGTIDFFDEPKQEVSISFYSFCSPNKVSLKFMPKALKNIKPLSDEKLVRFRACWIKRWEGDIQNYKKIIADFYRANTDHFVIASTESTLREIEKAVALGEKAIL